MKGSIYAGLKDMKSTATRDASILKTVYSRRNEEKTSKQTKTRRSKEKK